MSHTDKHFLSISDIDKKIFLVKRIRELTKSDCNILVILDYASNLIKDIIAIDSELVSIVSEMIPIVETVMDNDIKTHYAYLSDMKWKHIVDDAQNMNFNMYNLSENVDDGLSTIYYIF